MRAAGVTLVVLLAALAAWVFWPSGEGRVATGERTEAEGPDPAPIPGLSPAAPRPVAMAEAAPEEQPAPPTGRPADPKEGRLTVRITAPDGSPVREAVVLAYRAERRVAETTTVDGSAYVAVPEDPAAPDAPVRLIVAAAGFAVLRVWAPIAGGTHRPLDLKIPDGPALTGTVRDGAGNPVPGLRLLLGTTNAPEFVSSEMRDLANTAVAATARTDAEGRFSFRVAFEGERSVLADSSEWFVHYSPPRSAGSPGRVLLAAPARALTCHAKDPGGLPHAGYVSWLVSPANPRSKPMVASAGLRGGTEEIVWPCPDATDPWDARVLATPMPYGSPEQKTIARFEPGERSASCEVVIPGADDALSGRLVVLLKDDRGEPVSATFNATLAQPGAAFASLESRRMTVESPGRYVLERVPAGRHAVRVEPWQLLSEALRWEGEVDVPARGEGVVAAALPAFGAVAVKGAFRPGAPYVYVRIERTDVAWGPAAQSSPNEEFRILLPAGEWRVTHLDPYGKPLRPLDLRIVAGTEAVADFTK